VPAWSLAADQAVVTALGNDVGFELIFSRQVIAHAKPVDIAVAMSTSGNSDDLIVALAEAKKRGLLTIGFAGHDGGAMATSDDVDYCFTIHSQSIHRIQESHARVGFRLWSVVQEETRRRVVALMRAAGAETGVGR
jgi:D-sedoheptulose 7-phosphate isomerase